MGMEWGRLPRAAQYDIASLCPRALYCTSRPASGVVRTSIESAVSSVPTFEFQPYHIPCALDPASFETAVARVMQGKMGAVPDPSGPPGGFLERGGFPVPQYICDWYTAQVRLAILSRTGGLQISVLIDKCLANMGYRGGFSFLHPLIQGAFLPECLYSQFARHLLERRVTCLQLEFFVESRNMGATVAFTLHEVVDTCIMVSHRPML